MRATQKGQSLIEVLVAVAVGAVLVIGAAVVIAPSVKTTARVESIQTETTLANQLVDNLRVWSEGNWNNVLKLATNSTSTYYLITASSPFSATSGIESITINTSTFTRYFQLTNAYRDGSGNPTTTASGNTYDPSTMLVTVDYNAPNFTTSTISFYLTRNITDIYDQTDWSGGPGNNGPVTSTINQFVTSTNISYSSTTGVIFLTAQSAGSSSTATSSVNASNRWAWNDILGWIDFYNGNSVGVSSLGMTGYASSSAGDISLDCNTTRNGNICTASTTYQVTNNGLGTLSGWAWNDQYGWISFSCSNNSGCGTSNYSVSIDNSGIFHGLAWNDILGWISFNCGDGYGGAGCTKSYEVATAWLPSVSASTGTLYSTAFDTGVASGAQLNSILWQGTLPVGTAVEFKIATSSSSGGPWTFTGSDGTTSTYYNAPSAGVSVPLNYTLYNDSRYFRYEIYLSGSTATGTWSPQVNDVIVNWSP